jgi:hypothetical protein
VNYGKAYLQVDSVELYRKMSKVNRLSLKVYLRPRCKISPPFCLLCITTLATTTSGVLVLTPKSSFEW